MEIWLVAQTMALPSLMELGTNREWSFDFTGRAGDNLAEFAGRACYQSWSRPNEATRENKDYLANIINQGHESVFGHASYTFYITGVSRNLTHELIRHRFLAVSELSQRYVNMGEAHHVQPPAFEDDEPGQREMAELWNLTKLLYRKAVVRLEALGYSHKQAREAARSLLPSMAETRIVVTGNVRAWRDFIRQRYTPHADAEIYKLAEEILKTLKMQAPNSFQDFEIQEG